MSRPLHAWPEWLLGALVACPWASAADRHEARVELWFRIDEAADAEVDNARGPYRVAAPRGAQ